MAKTLPTLALLLSTAAYAQQPLTTAPPSGPAPRPYLTKREPTLTEAQKLALLRQHIKYVFVLFQENRSFDFYFGSYPGAEGLYSKPAAEIPGFTQPLVDTDGTVRTITPFRIPPFITDANGKAVPIYPSDLASVNHSHTAMDAKLNFDSADLSKNDRFALTEEGVTLNSEGKPSKFPSLERKQYGELVMGHLDCDTAPFLWRYADRFTLFDHFFATELGPSTPNAIAMISGQVGETQWMLHPEEVTRPGYPGVPMLADPQPFYGIKKESSGKAKQANDPKTKTNSVNFTFAALPLSFMGQDAKATTATDDDPAADLRDVKEDIEKIAGHPNRATPWGWYQQGYDHEPIDPAGQVTHKSYVSHHNAPAYFGYVANNAGVETHIHGLNDFFEDVAARRLPPNGVFYVRGGYGNIRGLHPLDPNPRLATVFNGNDDHPGYSDSQLSEALLAEEINAITQSPYWAQSAILIAYDESDGLYDHAQPHVRGHGPNKEPLDQGPRIPFLLISPYGNAHAVSHEPAEHSSIIKFVDNLFNLIPLADLPDEQKARAIGVEKFHEKNMGPADDQVEGIGNLFSAFSNARLLGKRPLLPASYAQIPVPEINAFPHYDYKGCSVMNIKPTDANLPNPIPADFNPRPDTTPGNPKSGNWAP
ncbi:phospholipase C [Granulicella tundricola]|uniref:Phosphoesterase n=1 Tax=Granulicella tundricola (strain ATCC BAA-1859 / DSM 23138 / MP5ACTX9) TaxID=1198114 RepID=E8WZC5_GRATM|nr:alkaline phosphatase family protein [Granulicella tundricola]ADW68813.1 phosphoesterase [Granulicella tundricola MP5ACTX9]